MITNNKPSPYARPLFQIFMKQNPRIFFNLILMRSYLDLEPKVCTVCPGSSDPAEKYLIYLHQKMRFTPFINYYDTLG